MNKEEILKMVDYTLLKQTATWEDIKNLCDKAIELNTASVCIPACFVQKTKKYVGERMKVCTVVGFPNGYSTTATKLFETVDALNNGADEIDMVININALKDKEYEYLLSEINTLKKACKENVLKVIVETCLLTEEEKIKICEIVSQSNADFIKTSTGFSTAGAQIVDIELFKNTLTGKKQIKASGGIRTYEDAKKMIEAGATRIGTSGLKD
jgi:deoxyribose-phosphate aldolase